MNTEDKKEHRTGWWRSLYYYMGWEYDSVNDYPKPEDVSKKQVLCKQVNLSKLKLNKVTIKPSVPFDLQKIKPNDKKVPLPLDDKKKTKKITTKQESVRESEKEKSGIKAPPSSPIYISQKQKQHKKSYSDRLKLLKNL